MKNNCLLKAFWGVLGVESFPLLPVRELEPLEGRERAGHEDGDHDLARLAPASTKGPIGLLDPQRDLIETFGPKTEHNRDLNFQCFDDFSDFPGNFNSPKLPRIRGFKIQDVVNM